jgi:NAD(P)-dependent dehydrogenase (short-subunit alcohol dehydrogenase family)
MLDESGVADWPKHPREAGVKPPFREPSQEPPGSSAAMRVQPDYGEATYIGRGRLKGRHALITGADSGIGRAVALAFAREGADVLISYLDQDQDAAETSRWVEEAGRKALVVRGSIESPEHCASLVDRAFRELGGLDILVNNAAYQSYHEKIEEFSIEEWERSLRVNVSAMFYLCREALPRMKEGSTIINTTSVNAFLPRGPLLAYATTKGAIVTFTRSLSLLSIERGVRTNAVAPGPVWTPLIPSTLPKDHVKSFGHDNPMKRPAQPVELAPAYVFLACDESRFINGAVMDVTGGEFLP